MTAPEPVGLTDGERVLAGVIWKASREDEGTISATGANHIARVVVQHFAAERAAREAQVQAGDRLREELRADLALLEFVGCQFFACEGPDRPPVDMQTCKVCWRIRELRVALAAAAPTPPQDDRQFDCMFHDERIPDAPCNCSDGKVRYGSHEIVTPPQDAATEGGR